jgi:hypothetical protein
MTGYPETDTREGNEKYCIAWSRMENQESVCGLLGYVQSYETTTTNAQFLPWVYCQPNNRSETRYNRDLPLKIQI